MQLHHQKHHQTYITNYNKALEQLDQALAKADSSSIVQLQSAMAEVSLSLSLSLSLHACCWNSFHSLMFKLRKNLWCFQLYSGSFFIDKNRASMLDILLRRPPNSKSKVHFLCFCFSKIESTANTNVSCSLWQSPPQPNGWKMLLASLNMKKSSSYEPRLKWHFILSQSHKCGLRVRLCSKLSALCVTYQ